MIQLSTGFSRALNADMAALELVAQVESALGPAEQVGGGLLIATAASGRDGLEIGLRLAERWPEAILMGSSFEGILANGQVWRDEPAVGLLAWAHGPSEPVPLFFDPSEADVEHLVHDVCEQAGRTGFSAEDLLLLFPDALSSTGLEAMLADLIPRFGDPSVAGAAASGLGGGSALAWFGSEEQAAGTIGLLIPGGGVASGPRVQCAGASRFASPWLEISACRERWIDGLDGEPPLDWVRRQLGLSSSARVAPYLDRLLIRLRDDSAGAGDVDLSARLDSAEEDRGQFVERYVIGIDDRTGAISVPGSLRRGAYLALALPDADRARETLRQAVGALAASPLVMQFACRARDTALYADPDLESALVAHAALGRVTFGTLAPFQLGPDAGGDCRMLVHSTVLAALGDV